MKRFIVPVALSAVLLWTVDPAVAQGNGGGPKTKGASGAVSHGGGSQGGGSAAHGGGSAAHGGAATNAGGGGSKHSGAVQHGSGAKAPKSNTHAKTESPKTAKSKTPSTTNTSTPTTSTTSTTTATTGTQTTLTAVQQKLQRNTNLAEKLQTRLPKGTDVIAAAADFHSLGQYVSTVNVSNNLRLDFAKLKSAILDDGMSLGQAIQAQKKTVDGTVEARRAQTEAEALIASTESSTTKTKTSTKSSTKTKTTKDDQQ